MKTSITILLFLLVTLPKVCSQAEKDTSTISVYAEEDLYQDDPYFWSYTKEVGINFTPLISKLVPFNLGENNSGNIGLMWKKYYSTRAFRVQFGANIENGSNTSNRSFIFLSLGLEKRYPITKDKKFTYTSGWDLFINVQEQDFNTNSSSGILKTYGFEYHFSKRLFISTEAQLTLSIGNFEGPSLKFQIPQAIFLNVRLY